MARTVGRLTPKVLAAALTDPPFPRKLLTASTFSDDSAGGLPPVLPSAAARSPRRPRSGHVAEVQGTVAPLPDCRAADIFHERASFRMCLFRVHRVYGGIVLTLLAEFVTG